MAPQFKAESPLNLEGHAERTAEAQREGTWNLQFSCLESASYIRGKRVEYAWDIHEHVWNMHGILMEYAWNIYGTCMLNAWKMHGICWEYAWKMHGMDMHRIFVECAWNA